MQSNCGSRGRGITVLLLVTCVFAIRVESAAQPTLNGTVLDPTGAVIANARVDLYSENHEWHTTTDAAGRFSFSALLPGRYDLEVTRVGFRKQIIQGMRIDFSEPSPMTITMKVGSTADSCGDFFASITYADATGEASITGVVTLVSDPGVTENGGRRVADSVSGATISLLKSGATGKLLSVRSNENGEFGFDGLEPGLYSLRASRKGYADFVISNVRVPPGKTLHVLFSMQPSGYVVLCM